MVTNDSRTETSSSTTKNHDTFAADLDVVLKTLDLRDVALVGFSMGTGEVTRYIGNYGTDRVRKAVLIGTLGPDLVKAPDNVEGVDPSVFEGLKNAIRADRAATRIGVASGCDRNGAARGRRARHAQPRNP